MPSVFLLAFVFFVSYSNRAILGPLLVHMERALGLDHAEATSLLSAVSLGYGIGVFFSGFIASFLAPRRIIPLSLIGAGIVMFCIARTESLNEARILFVLMGTVSGFYMPSALMTLGTLVRQESWSRAVAIHELAPNLSFILSPLIAEKAVSFYGWQGGMVVMGCLSVSIGVVYLFIGKGGTEPVGRPTASGFADALRRPVFWVFIWLFALGVAAEFTPYSVLGLSLTSEQGLSPLEASYLLSLSRLPTPLIVLLGGWAAIKLGVIRSITVFLALHGVSLVMMALPYSLVGEAGVFLAMLGQAVAAAFVFPALFTLFAESFPHSQQPLLLSLSVPAAVLLGGGLAPFLLGASGEYLSFASGYCIFGLVSLATLPALLLCKR